MRRKRSKGAKREAQVKHARRRALQRYGLELTKDQIEEITRKIIRGEGEFLERESNRLTHWTVEYQGKKIHAVYDSHRKSICTLLPPGGAGGGGG